ncbi:MAG TPA: hypothetical protein VIB39_20255 [Candidatus Angelobacter sp.]
MEPQTRERIVNEFYRLFDGLTKALGFENQSYEETMQFVHAGALKYGDKTVSSLLLAAAQKLVPFRSDDGSLRPESIAEYFAAIDTKEKLEQRLEAAPEPDPRTVTLAISIFRTLLPTAREVLLPFAKKLPHPPGGRPRLLSNPDERRRICLEIGVLHAKGVDLKVAQGRIPFRGT